MTPGALAHGNPDRELLAPVESVLRQRQAWVSQVVAATCATLTKLGIALIHVLDGARARAKESACEGSSPYMKNLPDGEALAADVALICKRQPIQLT